MNSMKKPLVNAVSAVLLMPLPGLVAKVAAQEATLEEIVVTARRAEESLQDVPASVTVLTENTLNTSGVNSVEGIVALTPGVSEVLRGEVDVSDAVQATAVPNLW